MLEFYGMRNVEEGFSHFCNKWDKVVKCADVMSGLLRSADGFLSR